MDDPERSSCLTRRSFLQLGAAATAVGLLQKPNRAAAAATPGPSPKRGGTFTLARAMGIHEFNPFQLFPGHFAYNRALYNTLLRYDPNLQPQSELAEKWELAPDGKSIRLKLRQGVKYHSGREFTSDDVNFSVEFAQTNQNSNLRALYKSITEVGAPDKYTVTFRFAQPTPGVFDILDTLYMLDKDTIADRTKMAIGTGPFRLDKYIPNDRIEMVAFKDYWEQGKPYLDKYVIRQVPDLAALAINLESGAVDCVFQPNYTDLVRFKASGGKFVPDMGAPGANMFSLLINAKAEPFQNKKVRQAMAWAINRARFARTILQGLVEPTCLMWPTHSWGYFKDLEGKIDFDLDKAKSLLNAAGLANGFDTEILTTSRNFGMGDLAQVIQADLKKIGVNAKVADLEQARFQTRINKGDIVMSILTYGRASRDPGSLVTGAVAWYSDKEGGPTHFESAEYDQLRKDLQSTLDSAKRKALARQIQELALDECFVNPVAPNQRAFAYGGYVKGFSYDMDNSPFVGEVWLNK